MIQDGKALPRDFIVGFNTLDFVAEEIDPHGVLRIDGINIENVAAERKHTLTLHRIFPRIARSDKFFRKFTHIAILPRAQHEHGKTGGHEPHKRFDIADENIRSRLPFEERGKPFVESVLRERLAIKEHLVLGGKKRDSLIRERGDRLRRPLCGERVRRDIHRTPLGHGSN